MPDKYTELADGTSRGGQSTLDYVVEVVEPVVQAVKDNPEVAIGLAFLFILLFGLFWFIAFNKFKPHGSDL